MLKQYPRLRATRLLEMIRSRGYQGSVFPLRRYVKLIRPIPVAEAFFRLSTLPGEQAQVDRGRRRGSYIVLLQVEAGRARACAPRFCFCFSFFSLFRRCLRSSGVSLDGGRCELREFCPSRSLSSATCLVSAATCCSSVAIRKSFAAFSARRRAFSASSCAIRSSGEGCCTPNHIVDLRPDGKRRKIMERIGSLTPRRPPTHPARAIGLNGYSRLCGITA
jgi:hypothetical protein